MEESLVGFSLAQLAKEKGFEGVCKRYYSVTNNTQTAFYSQFKLTNKKHYLLAPTQGLLQKWLREVHNINVFMNFKPNIKKWDFIPFDMDMNGTEYVKYNIKYSQTHGERRFDTYEEALEEGLQEGLKLINHE